MVASSSTTTPSTRMSTELPFQPSPNESYISSVQDREDPGLYVAFEVTDLRPSCWFISRS